MLIAVRLRADEERPYLFSQTLFLSLFNVISTEASAKRRNPPRKSPDNITSRSFSSLFVGVADGRAVRPTETKNDVPDEYLLMAVRLRAEEKRPYLFSQTLFLSLFNVISTEASAKRRNPPRKSPDNVSTIIFFDLFTRCGVWDTAASVPAAFLLLFSPPEKSRFHFFVLEKTFSLFLSQRKGLLLLLK